MKYLAEKEAGNLLENEGFSIVNRSFVRSQNYLKRAINIVGIPFVMKVSGKKIVHKNKLGGVKTNISTYSEAVECFSKFKKIKGSDGVVLQEMVSGKEFLLGIKKTREFGHVIVFGSGGVDVEQKKDISFRVCPLERSDIREMIKETKCSIGLYKKEGTLIENVILKLCDLVEKYPKISELDINPLIVNKDFATVADVRMVMD